MAQTTLTRRQWAGALAAAQAVAVAAPPQAPPADAAAPPDATDLLARAKQSVVRNREILAKFEIDRSVEPATRFEV